jgi:hypothetical protein
VSRVFLSYRREDSSDVTGRIYDRLVGHFGTDNVFKDVDSIPLGVDFRTHISGAVELCDVVLTIIGPRWLSAQDSAGARRLDDPCDFVRLEVGAALEREIPVIPVIVGGATMPTPEELPEAIREIAFRNGTSVRPDPDFHRDMDRLIAAVGEGKPPADHGSTAPARPEERVPEGRHEPSEVQPVSAVGVSPANLDDASGFRYDVFLSFVREDREWVMQNLYEPLRECQAAGGRSLRICLDWKDSEIELGQKSLKGLGEAIAASRQIVVASSRSYIANSMGRWRLMWMANLEAASERVVLILLEPVPEGDVALGPTWLEIRGVADWMARALDPQQEEFFRALRLSLGIAKG